MPPHQVAPPPPTPEQAAEILELNARLALFRQDQAQLKEQQEALKSELSSGIAKELELEQEINNIIRARQAKQQEKKRARILDSSGDHDDDLVVLHQTEQKLQMALANTALENKNLEKDIKTTKGRWDVLEETTVAIWGRLSTIMPFGSVEPDL